MLLDLKWSLILLQFVGVILFCFFFFPLFSFLSCFTEVDLLLVVGDIRCECFWDDISYTSPGSLHAEKGKRSFCCGMSTSFLVNDHRYSTLHLWISTTICPLKSFRSEDISPLKVRFISWFNFQMSSAAGKTPAPGQAMYSASKHALNGYFHTLRSEVWLLPLSRF